MRFNPFGFIFSSSQAPLARIKMTSSLWRRFTDVFFVVYGDPVKNVNVFLGNIRWPYQNRRRMGLFDYATLGIPALIHFLLAKLASKINFDNSLLQEVLFFIIVPCLILPRLIVSLLVAVISLPILIPIHLIVYNGLMKTKQDDVNNIGGADYSFPQTTYKTLGDFIGDSELRNLTILQPCLYKYEIMNKKPEDSAVEPNTLYIAPGVEDTKINVCIYYKHPIDNSVLCVSIPKETLNLRDLFVSSEAIKQLNDAQIKIIEEKFISKSVKHRIILSDSVQSSAVVARDDWKPAFCCSDLDGITARFFVFHLSGESQQTKEALESLGMIAPKPL